MIEQVEISPVPAENRYHSIFACPVSKEQATELNPPVMLTCGHVLARESVTRLAKNGSYVLSFAMYPESRH